MRIAFVGERWIWLGVSRPTDGTPGPKALDYLFLDEGEEYGLHMEVEKPLFLLYIHQQVPSRLRITPATKPGKGSAAIHLQQSGCA